MNVRTLVDFEPSLNEVELSKLSAPSLRLAQAKYHHQKYVDHCGPPRDDLFLMITYLDAFLATIVSVEELVPEPTKLQLRRIPEFMFMAALRNLATHHSIIATRTEPVAKFPRLFKRRVSVKVGGREEIGEAQFLFDGESFRETLTTLREDKKAKGWVPSALDALEKLELPGPVEFDAVLAEGICQVKALIVK